MAVTVVSDQEFNDTLSANPRVVVKYYADWCGSCKLFSPKYKRLSGDERFENVVFLDVDAENNPGARAAANVDNLPFFAVFKDGQLLDGAATAKEDVVVSMLKKLTA